MAMNRHLHSTATWHAILVLSHVNLFSDRIVQTVPAHVPVNMELIALHHSDMCAVLQVLELYNRRQIQISGSNLRHFKDKALIQLGKHSRVECNEFASTRVTVAYRTNCITDRQTDRYILL